MRSHQQSRPIVFGEVLFDHFPDGSRVLGGAPFNVAWNLHAFDVDPLLVSRVGNDPSGREVRDAMEQWGMDTSGLQLDSAHPTGAVQVSIRAGEPSFEIVPDQAYDFIDPSCLPPTEPRLIYHGTLALRTAISRGTLTHCRQRLQAPVFVDVNLRRPWWTPAAVLGVLEGARWVKLNASELEALVPEVADLERRAELLQARFDLDRVFVTRGAAGAIARDRDGTLNEVHPARDMRVVDAVGAGDAFASVLLLGLLQGWDLHETLERAQEFASAIVGQRGATVQDPYFYASFRHIWGLG